MKDFAKSIHVGNTKTEAEKVGNFEDPKKAKHYIEMWERRRDDAKRSLQNAEGHLKEAMKHRYGDKEFNQREVQRYQEEVKAAEALIKQYDDLIKSAAKTSFGNSKVGNAIDAWQTIVTPTKETISNAQLALKFEIAERADYKGAQRLLQNVISSANKAIDGIDRYIRENTKSGNSKVGNALKYTSLEEAKKMCQQMNDSLAPDADLRHYRHVYEKDGAYYVMETGEAVAKGMKRVGNKEVGNSDESYILSSYENKLKGYIAKRDKEGLKTLIRSAEAKYKETKKASENFYKEYKDADDASKKYWKIGIDAMTAINEIK